MESEDKKCLCPFCEVCCQKPWCPYTINEENKETQED